MFRKLYKWLFNTKEVITEPIINHNITVGEPDEKGFAYVYRDGEKTDMKMLLFTKEQCEKIQEAQERLIRDGV